MIINSGESSLLHRSSPLVAFSLIHLISSSTLPYLSLTFSPLPPHLFSLFLPFAICSSSSLTYSLLFFSLFSANPLSFFSLISQVFVTVVRICGHLVSVQCTAMELGSPHKVRYTRYLLYLRLDLFLFNFLLFLFTTLFSSRLLTLFLPH